MKVFKEEQRFTQTWLIVLLVISISIPIILMTQEYVKDKSSFDTTTYLMTLLGLLCSVAFIFLFKLNTRIDELGIHYQFFPFHLSYRTKSWTEVQQAYVRKYDAITEFGGWGLKGGALWKKDKGKAINVSGDIGIQLEFLDGKKLLIGTQKEQEAMRVLETYQEKIKNHVQ